MQDLKQLQQMGLMDLENNVLQQERQVMIEKMLKEQIERIDHVCQKERQAFMLNKVAQKAKILKKRFATRIN